MKAFTNSRSQTGRSSTACGYCRQRGHSIRDCPHVEYDFLEWQAFRVPHQSPTLQHNRWLANDYSYWVKQVNKYYPKWKNAQVTSSTGKRVTATRKCGFCRSEHHTRKDCTEMATIYANLLQANRNYRKAIYDKLVTQLGLGIGSVVKVQESRGYYANRTTVEHIATIIGFNLDTANVFQTGEGWQLDGDYCGDASIEIMVGDKTSTIEMKSFEITSPKGITYNGFNRTNRWHSVTLMETIAPSTQPLDSDWVDRDADAFDWLLKKRNKEWLEQRGCLDIIDRWK